MMRLWCASHQTTKYTKSSRNCTIYIATMTETWNTIMNCTRNRLMLMKIAFQSRQLQCSHWETKPSLLLHHRFNLSFSDTQLLYSMLSTIMWVSSCFICISVSVHIEKFSPKSAYMQCKRSHRQKSFRNIQNHKHRQREREG